MGSCKIFYFFIFTIFCHIQIIASDAPDSAIASKLIVRPRPPTKPTVPSVCDGCSCPKIDFCPLGEYLIYADPDNNVCCNYCKKYASLRQFCSYSYPGPQYCNPSLQCQPRYPDGPSSCTYQFENFYKVNCSQPGCPTFCSCPDGQYLVKADGTTRCCDLCLSYSRLGEYCDNKQRCYSTLQCGRDKICQQSAKCAAGPACERISSCPDSETYLVQADGLEQCCDKCQRYAQVGESCDDKQYCTGGSYCDYTNGTCVAFEPLNCAAASCLSVIDCGGSVIEADNINTCCPSCILY